MPSESHLEAVILLVLLNKLVDSLYYRHISVVLTLWYNDPDL
jgi:hypothetical protein